MFPVKFQFEVPHWAESTGVAERVHNRWVKDIFREELQTHLDKRIDQHFVFSARSRYGYTPRSQKYQRTKIKYRGRTTGWNPPVTFAADANLDLVKTGKTKREIKHGAKITVGGTGNTILGRLRLKVPIAGGSGRGVGIADTLRILSSKNGRRKFGQRAAAQAKMDTARRTISEIERFADDELKEISKTIAAKYAANMNQRRRVRKR